jgi:hypothetical protein
MYEDRQIDLTNCLKTPEGQQQLRPIQNQALVEAWGSQGLVGPIGVGLGKALITFLLPHMFGNPPPVTVLLVPSSVYDQTMAMYADAKEHWKVAPLRVFTYSLLPRKAGEDYFQRTQPDLIIADEAHYLRNRNAARTKRVLRYLKKRPSTKFVALSGTLTTKSLMDYAHLCHMALRDRSPLPVDKYMLEHWCNILDTKTEPRESDYFSFEQIFGFVGRTKKNCREVFKDYFLNTPGIVASSESHVKASLRIVRHTDLPAWRPEMYEAVWHYKCSPGGEYFEDDVSEWRCLRQISLGFYYRWEWQNGIRDNDWVEAKNNWACAVRYELENRSREGYDTPLLVARAIENLEVKTSTVLERRWYEWKEAKERPGPDTIAIWWDEKILKSAIEGWLERPGEIIWWQSDAVATKLEEWGYNVVRAGEPPPQDGTPVCLSIRSHGVGWNLQKYNRCLVLEPPANGQMWEQLIGRLHRTGQEADTVRIHVLQHTDVFRSALQKAKENARYYQETQGVSQRLCYGDYTIV